MELYRQEKSKFWTADFVVHGRRFRKSTKRTTRSAAMEIAMDFYRQAQQEEIPARKLRVPLLSEFAVNKFLPFVQASSLDADTKRYYETGWRLLSGTPARNWRINQVKGSQAEVLNFPASGANANCALRTLRRMLSLAHDWEIIDRTPRIRLRKEVERTAIFDAELEKRFLEKAPQPLRDVFLVSHDTGLRPDEVIRMRWENVLWNKSLIFVPDGKTEQAKRYVPLSDRVRQLLWARKLGGNSPWIFPSKRGKEKHISYFPVAKQFSRVRRDCKIPKGVVLYSARHSFATDMLDQTGNIALVGKILGHRSVTTTQRYLHPHMKDIAQLVNTRNTMRAAEPMD